jgi:hypothetical protein
MSAGGQSLEVRSLELLSRLQAELHNALNGLAGGQREGLYEGYLVYTAGHINRAVEGYLYLRESRRIDASKHLIRTGIEAVIRLQAVRKKPELLFRIAFTEFNEDKKWVRSTVPANVDKALSVIDKNWAYFKQAYHAKYPEDALSRKIYPLGLPLSRLRSNATTIPIIDCIADSLMQRLERLPAISMSSTGKIIGRWRSVRAVPSRLFPQSAPPHKIWNNSASTSVIWKNPQPEFKHAN